MGKLREQWSDGMSTSVPPPSSCGALAAVLLASVLVMASCQKKPQTSPPFEPAAEQVVSPALRKVSTLWTFRRIIMGVEAKVIVACENEAAATDHAAAAFTRLGELDAMFSDYRRDSELNQLCAAPSGVPHRVSADLFRVVELAQLVSQRSSGAFDISCGPLTSLWRTVRKSGLLASDNELADARARTGWRKIVLDRESQTITLAQPRMQLDLGGIAKGYAAADAVRVLVERGAPSCFVALAGDIAVGDPPPHPPTNLSTNTSAGSPPSEPGWRIAPGPDSGMAHAAGVLLLANASVSTSGDSQQFVEIAGQRYAHIVDPQTGLGASRVRAATVVVPHDSRGRALCGATADAIATAFSLVNDTHAASLISAAPIAPAAASIRDLANKITPVLQVGDARLFRLDPPANPPPP